MPCFVVVGALPDTVFWMS